MFLGAILEVIWCHLEALNDLVEEVRVLPQR